MQHRLSVYPDLGGEEFEALLEAELARRGQAVLEKLAHADGQAVYPLLSQRLAAHGGRGTRALAFHQPVPEEGSIVPPATIVHHAGEDSGDDPLLAPLPTARALSRAGGGWALALAASRTAERYALGAFYAGRTLEAAAWDGETPVLRRGAPGTEAAMLADSEQTWAALAALYRAVTHGHEGDLRWATSRAPVRSWIVSAPAAGVDAAGDEPDLRRAVFVDATAARLRDALASLPAVAVEASSSSMPPRVAERSAPVTGTPYALLDGDFDDAAFVALARRLDAQAAAVEMRGGEETFTWCAVDASGRVQAGVDGGALRFAAVWSALMGLLGEAAAIVR